MSMELDDLLEKEGLDATGIEDALTWARGRAAELVRGVDGDPELGPLLGGAGSSSLDEGPPTPGPMAPRPPAPPPMYSDLRGLQAAFLAEEGEEAAELPDVGAVLRVFKKARTEPPAAVVGAGPDDTAGDDEAMRSDETTQAADGEAAGKHPEADDAQGVAEPADEGYLAEAAIEPPAVDDAVPDPDGHAADASDGAAAHDLPAPPEADLDPLAGIDFDDLPGLDEDDEEDDHTHVDLPSPSLSAGSAVAADHEIDGRITMVPSEGSEMTLPSMQAPLNDASLKALLAEEGLPSGDLTERTVNPLLGARAEPLAEEAETSSTSNPSALAAGDTVVPPEEPAAEPSASPAEVVEAVDVDEIEMLDDDDLLMFEEEEDEPEEVPEWKQALVSAQLDAEGAPPEPAADEGSADEGSADGEPPADDGQDVDLGDL